MDDRTGALILYAYTLGGNTREIARLMGAEHDEVTDALMRASHLHALRAAGITEDEWRASCGAR
jgi:hypothetical protein